MWMGLPLGQQPETIGNTVQWLESIQNPVLATPMVSDLEFIVKFTD